MVKKKKQNHHQQQKVLTNEWYTCPDASTSYDEQMVNTLNDTYYYFGQFKQTEFKDYILHTEEWVVERR